MPSASPPLSRKDCQGKLFLCANLLSRAPLSRTRLGTSGLHGVYANSRPSTSQLGSNAQQMYLHTLRGGSSTSTWPSEDESSMLDTNDTNPGDVLHKA